MSKQDLYIARIQRQLDELNTQMGDLEDRAKEARLELKEKYLADMTQLRVQSQQASDKLDELRTAAEGSWGKMVADMERLRHAFTHSFHYFKSQV